MKDVLKYLGSFLFVAILLAKVSAFHIYEHQDDSKGHQDQCEYCLLVIESQQTDIVLTSSTFAEDKFLPSVYQIKTTTVDSEVDLNPFKTEQLPRPPPAVL